MKYFIDTEFLEGTQTKRFLGIPFGKTPPTIDLISIGIVSEDGREYYAISKDFNLDEAWNRFDLKTMTNLKGDSDTNKMKVFWIRENVLKPIFEELAKKEGVEGDKSVVNIFFKYSKKELRRLINKYGKSREQIAEEIKEFIYKPYGKPNSINHIFNEVLLKENPINFYGYYSDYDHVALCWLFGKMIDLPTGFPMYTIDLKQELDRKVNNLSNLELDNLCQTIRNHPKEIFPNELTLSSKLYHLKQYCKDYPKQTNEHNALADARWNKKLYEFLQTI